MMERALDSSFDDVARSLAPEVRTAAREAGWPEEVVLSLTVESRNGHLIPSVPDHLREVVEGLEFGTTERPPTGVLHKAFYSNEGRERTRKKSDRSLAWVSRDLNQVFR